MDTRFPNVPEFARSYSQSYLGHWLVRFSQVSDDEPAGEQPFDQELDSSFTLLARPGYCLVNGFTGELYVPPPPLVVLPMGYAPDAVDWDAVFGPQA